MTYCKNSQAISGDLINIIDVFCEQIRTYNFNDARQTYFNFIIDTIIPNNQSEELIERAFDKILTASRTKLHAAGWATTDFRPTLYKLARHGQQKNGLRLSENTGVRLQVNMPENAGCSQNDFAKTITKINDGNMPESLISLGAQPNPADASLLAIYTPTPHTNQHTTNSTQEDINSKTDKGKNGAQNLVPHGTGSIIDLAKMRTKCASRKSSFDRSAPNGIIRSKVNQAAVDALPDPYLTTRYEDQSEDQILAQSFIVAANNNGIAFRLSVCESLAKEYAKKDGKPAARALAALISKRLKDHYGSCAAFSFKFEVSASQKLHIHGVMCLDHSKLTDAEKDKLKRALCRAGGVSLAKQGTHICRLYDPLGYFGYLKKDEELTRSHIGSGKLTYANRLMVQFVKKLHSDNKIGGRDKKLAA